MKIYNEIVIDMNPESSSYGETLHEDSYEYIGDMMLMQGGQITLEEGKKPFYVHKTTGERIEVDVMSELTSEDPANRTFGESTASPGKGKESYKFGGFDFPLYEQDEAGAWKATGEYKTIEGGPNSYKYVLAAADYPNLGSAPAGAYDYGDEGAPDVTSEQFKTSVETYGGFEDLATLHGQDPSHFEEFYDAPLEQYEAEYGEGGTLEEGRGLDLATIAETQRAGTAALGIEKDVASEQWRADVSEYGTSIQERFETERAGTAALDIAGTRSGEAFRAGMVGLDIAGERATEGLRAATVGAKMGRRSAGLQAGRSVSDIFAQTAAQQERGGFGAGGAASATARRAQRGVMGDYNLQQQQLAEGMTQARSAFDISQQEITSGRKAVGSAWETSAAEIASGRLGVEKASEIAGTKIASFSEGMTARKDIAEKGIASGKAGVAAAAEIGTARVDLAGKQAGIDWERKVSDFWKGTEDEFYDRLNFLESQG